jgi:NAD(P)-dependent dehydrogenase (short-subunit alcohol dehydrogenase family)
VSLLEAVRQWSPAAPAAPGSGLIRTARTGTTRQEAWDSTLAGIPRGRAGAPEEVAGVVLFLAGDLTSCVTGTTGEVTSGRHA